MAYKEPPKPCDVAQLVADMGTYFERLNEESDRGVILASADLLDWHLKVLARQKINVGDSISNKKRKELLKSFFNNQGMIGSFSNTTKFCYGMDLIHLSTYEKIEAIRDIRNDVAHSFGSISFNDESITSRIQNYWKSHDYLEDKIKSGDTTELEYGIDFQFGDYEKVLSSIKGSPIRVKFIEQVFNVDGHLIMQIHEELTRIGYNKAIYKDGKLVQLPDEPISF